MFKIMEKVKDIRFESRLIMTLLIIIIVLSFSYCHSRKGYKGQVQLTEAIEDSLRIFKDKENLYHAKIKVLETSSVKDFLKLNSKDKDIKFLQEQVKLYKNKIKGGGSVTTFSSNTRFDTVYKTNTKYINKIVGVDSIIQSIKNEFIEITISIC